MGTVINIGLGGQLLSFVRSARAQRRRPYLQWAEEELRLPDGPYKGLRYKAERQPFSGLYLQELDKGWKKTNFVGPTQSGKTLTAWVIPVMYDVFEAVESVVCGVPDLATVNDKWTLDLLPAILASRYAEMLPVRGQGSQSGRVTDLVRFRNGAAIRFMTGGGGDKSRAGFTAPNLRVTETDGLDQASEASAETDKLGQLEGRVASFGDAADISLECTVTTQKGRTWREHLGGTETRIAMPCVHCGEFVTPGREHFHGWQDARNVMEARERSRFHCPACNVAWSEEQRRESARDSLLVHAGQGVNKKGELTGEPKPTNVFSMRASAVDNLFRTCANLGEEEFRASRAEDEELASRKVLQQVWAIPISLDAEVQAGLSQDALMRRWADTAKGQVNEGAAVVVAFMDLGKHVAHWVAGGLNDSMGGVVIDYDVIEVQGRALGEERAIRLAIEQFADKMAEGFADRDGVVHEVDLMMVDAGNWTEYVTRQCDELANAGMPILPCMGFGDKATNASYAPPKKKNKREMPWQGVGCHIERVTYGRQRYLQMRVDVDLWKTNAIDRLGMDVDIEGAVLLHRVDDAKEHLRFARHLTAETKERIFKPGKGEVTVWNKVRRENHFLDAYTGMVVAGHKVLSAGRVKQQTGARVVSLSDFYGG